MRFHNSNADLFVPDGVEPEAALARTTHLAISPLEFMQRLAVLTRLTPQPAALRRPNQSIECLEKVG